MEANQSQKKRNKRRYTVSLIDAFLLLAFALLVAGVVNRSKPPPPEVHVLSISQELRHLRFIVHKDQFIALDQLDQEIQMSGNPNRKLGDVKKCIEEKLFAGAPTQFQYLAESNPINGITLTKPDDSNNISLMINLKELFPPVYLGFDACCEERTGPASVHPIQGLLYDSSKKDPLGAIEVWFDRGAESCLFDPTKPNVLKRIAGPKSLSVSDTINKECNVGVLVVQ